MRSSMNLQPKYSKGQYVDVLICFCRYYLISKHMPHEKAHISNFLKNTNTKSIIEMATTLKEGTLTYDIWQIFTTLDADEIDSIKKAAAKELIDEVG